MKRNVSFVVNGSPESAMGMRARGLSRSLPSEWALHYCYRLEGGKLAAARQLYQEVQAQNPEVLYVLDMAVSGAIAGMAYKLRHGRALVIDTGDAITALARNAQLRGPAGLAATWALEESSLRYADRIVVRGEWHQEYLAARGIASTWIPDGFEKELFYPAQASPAREFLCVGLIGSVIWNGRLESTYGWDLVETLAALPDLPVRGLLVGDGSGLEKIREHAVRRGVKDRILFAGRIPYQQLREWITQMDICLSTQTNDLPGQVRTTGKLPLYLACGRFILASRVGQASRVLPEEMLLEYEGQCDLAYPGKIAARIRELHGQGYDWHATGQRLAAQTAMRFEYEYLSRQVADLIEGLCTSRSG
jgi:glycosyltransferase involved in cell wall biosynthesis